jgi:hypothetical protein
MSVNLKVSKSLGSNTAKGSNAAKSLGSNTAKGSNAAKSLGSNTAKGSNAAKIVTTPTTSLVAFNKNITTKESCKQQYIQAVMTFFSTPTNIVKLQNFVEKRKVDQKIILVDSANILRAPNVIDTFISIIKQTFDLKTISTELQGLFTKIAGLKANGAKFHTISKSIKFNEIIAFVDILPHLFHVMFPEQQFIIVTQANGKITINETLNSLVINISHPGSGGEHDDALLCSLCLNLNDNALIFSGDKYLWINETSLFKRCYLSIDRDESEELKNYKMHEVKSFDAICTNTIISITSLIAVKTRKRTRQSIVETNPSVVESKSSVVESKPLIVESKPLIVETKPLIVETKPPVGEIHDFPIEPLMDPLTYIASPMPYMAQSMPYMAQSMPYMTESMPYMTQSYMSQSYMSQTMPYMSQTMPHMYQTMPHMAQTMPYMTQTTLYMAQPYMDPQTTEPKHCSYCNLFIIPTHGQFNCTSCGCLLN